MQRIRVQLAVAVVAACFSTAALSHDERDAAEGIEPLDCDRLPGNAVTGLPEAIRHFAQLECAPNGQLIVAREDWVWRYPASYFDRPFIASYTPLESRSKPGPRWFTSLVLKELTGDAARRRHEALVRALPNYTADPVPKSVYHLLAKNELGDQFDVYFPMMENGKGWGAVCAPECQPQMLFMIYRQE